MEACTRPLVQNFTVYSFTNNTESTARLLSFTMPILELYHPSLMSFFNWNIYYGFQKPKAVSLRHEWLILFLIITISLSSNTLSPSGPGSPHSVWGRKQPAGRTFGLSSNFQFSSRFCVEPLDSFLRPPRPIIICLGLSGDHCLLSLGSL